MAIVVELNTKEITLSGSPQFLRFSEAGAPQAAGSYFLDLYIWRGDKGSKPTQPEYQLQVPAIVSQNTDTFAEFEVSKYLQEFTPIDSCVVPSVYSNRQYNGLNGCWYTWTVSTNAGGLPLDSPDTFFAMAGVGEYRDGINPGSNIVDWLGVPMSAQPKNMILDVNDSYCLPIYVGSDVSNVNTVLEVNGVDLIVFTDDGGLVGSQDSAYQVMYLELGADLFGSDWAENKSLYFKVGRIGEYGERYNITVGCYLNETAQLRFQGYNGTQLTVPLLGRKNKNMETVRQTFLSSTQRNSDGSYDPTRHVKKTFRVVSRFGYVAYTGWTNAEIDKVIEQLDNSYAIWFLSGGEIIPVNVKDVSRGFINRIYNDQVGYTLNLEVSIPVINEAF